MRYRWLFVAPVALLHYQGKVAEVVDGGNIVVVSGNHPLKVRLIAVAAPEKNQSYAGVARQHLSDLILNKYVVVRYSVLRDGYLFGQVLAGDMDVGAQMIRDGYAGRQYTRSGGPATGVVRILSKQTGDEREVFMLCVLSGPESEESGDEFLNSFMISQNQTQ